jgi:ABC-type antimicrobial peptide transport system permease subunit
MKDPEDLAGVVRAFEGDNRLQYFVAKREKKYFEEQSEMMATFIRILGIFITVIFSTGSTIGAMITMYGSVANRTTEIGTLRALGFFRRSILLAFLLESLTLAFAGGLLGLGIASVLQFFTISTLNFGSFSELAFSFAMSPSIVASALGFSLLMGLIGGFLPALRASRSILSRRCARCDAVRTSRKAAKCAKLNRKVTMKTKDTKGSMAQFPTFVLQSSW